MAESLQAEAAELLSQAITTPAAEESLSQALAVLEKADEILGPKQPSLESMLLRGFHALASYVLLDASNELKRAETLLNSALNFSSSPRARFGQAILLAHRGEWQQALASFREVLMRAAVHPAEVPSALRHLRFALATCFAGLGRVEKAKRALLAVVTLDHLEDLPDPEALSALAYLAAREGSQEEAMEYMSRAMQVAPDHPVVLCQAANYAFFCGLERANGEGPAEWQLASSILDRAFAAGSKQVQAEVQFQRGRLAHAKGEFSIAMDDYKRCLDLLPEHLAAAYALAQCYVEKRFYSGAIKLLEKMPKHVRHEPKVLKLLTAAYLATNEHNKQARNTADSLVEVAPDVEAWAMKAEAYTRGDPKEAVAAYEELSRLLQDPSAQTKATPEMWNNMGTILGTYGDASTARHAYDEGIKLVERQILHANRKEKKELEIARLTLRFNKAWLAETNPSHPEIAEAMSEYLSLTEENGWFADAFLRLGKQWQSLGQLDSAMSTFRLALEHAPFQARLHCAEAQREAGNFQEALRWGERMLTAASEKEEHYALVFQGNLYFEAASHPKTSSADKDLFLRKATECYYKALENKCDCHFAANGIGMVFARRGKPDQAKLAFQSVLQHRAGDNPSLYVNLAHTYMERGALGMKKEVDDPADSEQESEERITATRKAISFYQMAKKLQPEDVSVTLYIARCYNKLKAYDDAAAILSEAAHNWPFDIIVKLNQAKNWEDWAKRTLREFKRLGTLKPNCVEKVSEARDHLSSAVAAWSFIGTVWDGLTDAQRRALNQRAQHLEAATTDISGRIQYLNEFIANIKQMQRSLVEQLKEIDYKQEKMNEEQESAKEYHERAAQESAVDKERHLEAEDQALRLMDSTKHIKLGKNLEALKDKASKKQKTEEKREASQEPEQRQVPTEANEEVEQDALGEIFEDDEVVVPERREKKKKEKKDKKGKEKKDKDKKDKKEKKKEKKRKREET